MNSRRTPVLAWLLAVALLTFHAPEARGSAILADEHLWPYRVALLEPLEAPGSERTLPRGTVGVLIRVEPDGRARIDFGRDGLYSVPVEDTDLVDRMEAVRSGRIDKLAPNLVLAIGRGLFDPAPERLRAVEHAEVAAHRRFLCVFADPSRPDFESLARALDGVERADLLTILFPQGGAPDDRVRARLREVGWSAPFFRQQLAVPHTRSLLGEPIELPTLAVFSAEGRLLYRDRFRPDRVGALEQALGPANLAAVAER